MTARDELAAIVATSLDTIFGTRDFGPAQQDYKLADALIAAGYVKHRTITTTDEVDALPVESVVRSGMNNVYVKDYDLDDPSAIWWVTAGAVSEFQSNRILLPATVLYELEADQ